MYRETFQVRCRKALPRFLPVASKLILAPSLLIAACVCTDGFGVLRAQTLTIVPSHVMPDESAVIRASGLQPNERITIRADLVDGGAQPWTSEADFIADAQGIIDVSQQAPVKGSYDGVSAMGLIWSMKPAAKNVNIYEHPKNLGSQTIQFRLLRKGEQASAAELEELWVAEDVQRIRVEGQLHGVLFVPNTSERHPGVLVVGGSEGGVPVEKAAWLASRGFAALALAYFGYEDLPPRLEAIPLEYFGRALGWMMERPDILADRIAVVGTSRGAELALQLGAMYPQVKAVVAYVPANVRVRACCGNNMTPWAWTLRGQPLPYLSMPPRPGQNPPAESVIEVEQTHGPILLISGQDDGVWPSSTMADAVVDRLKRAHFSYDFEHLKYAHAGHAAGRPEVRPTWHGSIMNPISGRAVDPGGTVAGNAQSTLDAMPKVLQFMRQSLETGVSR
jgi:dienelactone hydrolase